VTVIYAVLGFTALYFSDVYLPRAIDNPNLLSRNQFLKGGVEVALTAGLIFVLTRRSRLALRDHKERLETLQAERSVLHRVFRHNLRQELNLIDGHAALIRPAVDETTAEHCDVIDGATGRIGRYVDKANQFEKLLQPSTEFREVDIVAVVSASDLVADAEASEGIELTVDLPDNARIIGHSHVGAAFHEVFENALAHNDSSVAEIDITVTETADGLVELAVADNGPGIPDIERRSIESMEELPLTHSGGLGLWYAKLACTMVGGDLELRSVPGGGSEVVLQFPKATRRPLLQRLTAGARVRAAAS
jgi:signal transduction histidine kinase